MDDKTEELRDIFLDVAEDPSVTTAQTEARGSLAGDEAAVDERLRGVIERFRTEAPFETDLDPGAYVGVVRGFFGGTADATIAATHDLDEATVFRARGDLHLLREDDAAPVDPMALETHLETEDPSPEEVRAAAEALGVDVQAVERALRVREVRRAVRQTSGRYRSALADPLPDADIAERFTADAREDGLREATEDAEVDVDL